jgi:excisionase family DNA binding protein
METVQRQLLTRREAAAVLGFTESGVRKLTERGELPVVHVGRAVRVRAADIEAIVARGTPVRATGQAAWGIQDDPSAAVAEIPLVYQPGGSG